MIVTNQTKIVPYSHSISYSIPRTNLDKDNTTNDRNRQGGDLIEPVTKCCTCPCACFGGLALLLLLCFAIGIPILVSIKSSTMINTDNAMSTSTTTTTTTGIPCSPSCKSEEVCVLGKCIGIGQLSFTLTWSRKGDGDIVVGTTTGKNIFYNNTGSSSFTDYGKLDVDDRNGTGPENVFWSNLGPTPPAGVYYVCFEPYSFNPLIDNLNPISVTIDIKGSNNNTFTFTKNFTSTIKNDYHCNANSSTLLTSYTYP
ncbi:hypothetical protein I4U23_020269 [Adineta vaga]|nr:hypothetical protein I4U23_020269 [Adineta vaga]